MKFILVIFLISVLLLISFIFNVVNGNKEEVSTETRRKTKGELIKTIFEDVEKNDEEEEEGGTMELKQYKHRINLTDKLLESYNNIIPGADQINLQFGISLNSIVVFDYLNQILVTRADLSLEWNDERLRWNVSEFGGVNKLSISPFRIWRLFIILYKSPEEAFDGTFPVQASVNYEGIVQYNPPGLQRSQCLINDLEFPFDYQHCSLKFGLSYNEEMESIDFNWAPAWSTTEIILRNYENNSMWDIVNLTLSKTSQHIGPAELDSEGFEVLTLNLTLRRQPLYYIWTLLFPILVISYTLPLLLLIPIGRKEKIFCTILFFEFHPQITRYWIPYVIQDGSSGITIWGKFSMLINIFGMIIVFVSVLELNLLTRRKQDSLLINQENFTEELKINGFRAGGHGSTQVESEQHLAPSFLDKMLVIIFYIVMSGYLGFIFLCLPWMRDSRTHL